MSEKFIKFIVVDATRAPYDSSLQAVALDGIAYPLPNALPAGSTVENDLTKLEGFPTGTQFKLKLIATGIEGGESTSPQIVTYSRAPPIHYAYFEASGSITNPVITFIEFGTE